MRERSQPGAGARTMSERSQRSADVREVILLFCLAFGGIVLAKAVGEVVPIVGKNVKAVAAGLFLYLPTWRIRRREESLDDFGIPDLPWRSPQAKSGFLRDLGWGAAAVAVLIPVTTVGFFGILELEPHLPGWLRWWIPYENASLAPRLRLPDGMGMRILDQALVVALPEELFFRGFVQTRLKQAWGEGRFRLFGVRVGAYFWVTQLLFAVAHLGGGDFSRLSVFLPALLFGWLKERTGSIGASVWVHAASNLLLMVLEFSVFR